MISVREDYKEQSIFFFKMDAKDSIFRIRYSQKYSHWVVVSIDESEFLRISTRISYIIQQPSFYEKSCEIRLNDRKAKN